VVIDVLRATSVIVHAMSEGAIEIVPVATVEDAFQKVKAYPSGTTLLGGERESRKVEGFDLGNSPREYAAERVKGKRLILTTTNGTKAFHFVSAGSEVMVGSFFNIEATARRCVQLKRDLLIFLSGDEGNFSIEDAVCGGMLIEEILKKEAKRIGLTDAAHCALILYQRFEENLLGAFHLSRHGKELIDIGAAEDLLYCTQTDITALVPTFRDGVIK
jgi:2-phosphosulfolactate phosphatase